jgi:flagellar biosynthesis regulator FlaF
MTTTTKEQYGAYASTGAPASVEEADAREIDRRALLNCAARLNVALADAGKDMPAYADALRHNQKLWTMFQVALCDPENTLPRHLKMILLNLSRYVDRTSFRAITEFAPQLLTSLIDVNRAIAAGLNKKQIAANPAPRIESPPPAQTSSPSSVTTTA